MKNTNKVLKILAALLAAAALIAGAWLMGAKQPQPQTPETTAVPMPTVPDFTVYDAQGNAHKLSDFRGKPVILNFWASWCGPCKAEMPAFEEKYLEYGDEIHFLVVNLTDGRSETVETASGYIGQQGYTFPVYYDTTMEAALVYGISSIPMSYFIDAAGVAVDGHLGMMSGEEIQAQIDGLLGIG